LAQDVREAAQTKAGTNSVADVPSHLRKVGVELVPNRDSADNR